jgi:hypothetical protein
VPDAWIVSRTAGARHGLGSDTVERMWALPVAERGTGAVVPPSVPLHDGADPQRVDPVT